MSRTEAREKPLFVPANAHNIICCRKQDATLKKNERKKATGACAIYFFVQRVTSVIPQKTPNSADNDNVARTSTNGISRPDVMIFYALQSGREGSVLNFNRTMGIETAMRGKEKKKRRTREKLRAYRRLHLNEKKGSGIHTILVRNGQRRSRRGSRAESRGHISRWRIAAADRN